jgi:ArsR family transcriptional regulator
MNKLIKRFKALSDITRLRILNILLERECCVCEVMQALNISQTRASRNLNILYNAGFLKYRRNGLWILYSIDKAKLKEHFIYLNETVRRELESNPAAKKDKIRLAKAVRIGTECCSSLSPN